MNRQLKIVIRIVAIAAVAAAMWWFVREMDFAKFGHDLATAKRWPLVVAASLNFVCLLGKAVCWRIMLAPRHKVSVLRLFRYTVAAFAASAIAPARAGELLRVWALKRRDGVPAADTVAVAVAEKVLDGISMLIIVAPVPLLLPGLPRSVAGGIALVAAIFIALFIALFIAVGRVDAVGRADETKLRALLRRFLAGMHVVRSPKRVLGTIGLLLLVWAADLGEVMAVLYAVDIHLPIAAGLLILFTLNLTIMVPSTPAQAGALEAGALLALDLLHVGGEAPLAFALLYHLLQVIPLIAVGLLLEWRLVLGREGDAAAGGMASGDPAEGSTLAPPPAEPPAASV
jgi:uncharacterized protein (TIRG00374 family)